MSTLRTLQFRTSGKGQNSVETDKTLHILIHLPYNGS